ncbi:MAG: hypothetical protein KGH94_04465 [Candidatus Micrarchaeota archaeon]|nr:hypothetical protein [Candidatus Micrarchaeota archaeon]
MADLKVDPMGLVVETKGREHHRTVGIIVAVTIIIILLYAAFSTSNLQLPNIGNLQFQLPGSSSMLLSQLNHSWNYTEVNSTFTNSSYDMAGSISGLG